MTRTYAVIHLPVVSRTSGKGLFGYFQTTSVFFTSPPPPLILNLVYFYRTPAPGLVVPDVDRPTINCLFSPSDENLVLLVLSSMTLSGSRRMLQG